MVTHSTLMIIKLEHQQFGAASERGRKLVGQMVFELEELEANVAEGVAAMPEPEAVGTTSAR
jgi:transposase